MEQRAVGATPVDDPFTAMTPRLNALAGRFARRFFARIELAPEDAERLRALEQRGAVVYVMRYGSRLDYLLFNWLFLAAGLRLSSGANGIWFYYYRPLREALPLLLRQLALRLRSGSAGLRERGHESTRRILASGASAFLFLRTDKIAPALLPRAWVLRRAERETDYLREMVDAAGDSVDFPVALVPLALFWRRGPAPRRTFFDVFYGGPERPRSWVKLLSFLLTYRGLSVRVGEPVQLREVIGRHGHEGRERVVKRVRRALLIFLRREERPVVGPALRSFARVHAEVMAQPDVRAAIRAAAEQPGGREERARATASRYLQKIAANPGSVVLAVLAVSVRWIMRRLFTRFEVHGLEAIIEAAKLHPLVLLPSHRSHFDYVILSSLFYERHVVPPHVAAGENLSFWPLGALFRRAGAFFLRRSFEGDRLYAAIFRAYVQLLIKDGVTQEFFVEGTRSRTGKTLQPRLGLLHMVVEAYARGVRRELYLVPVGFTYDRLVEEGALSAQRRGAPKTGESLLGLLRARAVLGSRFGAVSVRFGTPIPLSRSLAAARAAGATDLRSWTHTLAIELSRRINELITASCSAVASAALLADPGRAVREELFCERVIETAALLEAMGMALDPALQRCIAESRVGGAAAMLVVAGYVQRSASERGAYLELQSEARDRLDYYRASLTPLLVWPATLALALRAGGSLAEILARAGEWLDVLALEYFPAEGAERQARLLRVLEHEHARGWVDDQPSGPRVTADGVAWQEFWWAQIRPVIEAYAAVFDAVVRSGGYGERRALAAAALVAQRDRLALGEARHPEGVCPVAVGNALDWLVARGLLEAGSAPGDAALRPGPRWPELAGLETRVAAALAG